MVGQVLPPPPLPDADEPKREQRSETRSPAMRGPLGELSAHISMIVALLITVALVTGVAFGLALLFTAWTGP